MAVRMLNDLAALPHVSHRIHFTLAAIVVILVSGGCSKQDAKVQDLIIGKWQQEGGASDGIEFFAGGGFVGTRTGVTNILTGTYKFCGSTRMQLEYQASPAFSQPRMFDVSITGESLVLTDGSIRWTYRRAK